MTDIKLLELASLIADAEPFGALHIVIEDLNVDDENLAFCRGLPELKANEARILQALDRLNEEEREAIIILAYRLVEEAKANG